MTAAPPTTAIKAAMSVARDLAEGRLAVSQLDGEVAGLCREMFAHVIGADDPLFELQIEVARGVLAVGGVPANELAEWLAVTRQAEGIEEPAPEPSWIERALATGPDCICPPSTASGLEVECPVHDVVADESV